MAYVYSNPYPSLTSTLSGYLAEESTEPWRVTEPEGFRLGSPMLFPRADASLVRWAQGVLNRVMRAGLALDGVLGLRTREAIRRFQQQRGLRPDGVLGPETERALRAASAAPPARQAPTVQPSPRGLRLIRTETFPPTSTFYVEIALGGEPPARPMTGIFVPSGYRPQPRVDLVLYLHGHKQRPTIREDTSIDQYWNRQRFPYWLLREGVNESRKNVILVAPTLGPRSQAGTLTRPGGFDAYIEQIRSALRDYGPYRGRTPPEVGNVILACHSGGGLPMRQLATASPPQRYTSRIRECWGFDCLYNTGDEDAWAHWSRTHPGARLFVYYLDSTAPRSRLLQRQSVPNVFVARSTARAHNWVPITHWRARFEGAPFLLNV